MEHKYRSAYDCTQRPETVYEDIQVDPEHDLVEREGYIPFDVQIESMMVAGTRLRELRNAMYNSYDYDDDDDESRTYSEEAVEPDMRRDFDMADVSSLNNEYQDKAYRARRAKKKQTEEPVETEPKEHEPVDPEPTEPEQTGR